MFDRQTILDDIISRLSWMETCLKWHTGRGHAGHCKAAEDVVARFLGALCGWELVNLNFIRANYPAADLADVRRRIAVQVTVNGTGEKIRETHSKAKDHGLEADFDRLVILFLLPEAPKTPRASTAFQPCTKPVIETWARPDINKKLDSLSTDELEAVLAVLKREMSKIDSILRVTREYVPQNLPYASLGSLFKGRETFLQELRESLTDRSATVIKGHAIHGMGGVGKTRTAVEYAWRFAGEYSALLFVEADSPEALSRNLAALCGPKILNLTEQNAKEQEVQENAVLRWLQDHPGWLLIIDNADTAAAIDAADRMLTRLPAGHVIITTRQTDYSGAIHSLELDVLSRGDAVAFLYERTAGHRTPAPDDEVRALDIANMLDGLAIALEQAAAYIRRLRLRFADYITRWQQHTATILEWHDKEKMKYPRSLAVTFDTSVEQISPEAKEFLNVISWLAPNPIPLSCLEQSENAVARGAHLAELENLSLAQRRDNGTSFSVHRILQEITRLRQKDTQSQHALTIALKWLKAAFAGDPTDVRSWPTLDPLAQHVCAVAFYGDAHGIVNPTAWLYNQAALLLNGKAQHQSAEPLLRRALAINEASAGNNHPKVAASLSNLAQLLQGTNRLTEAEPLMRRALAIDEASFGKDHPEVATDLNNLAALLKIRNRLMEAEPLMRRSLAIDEAFFGENHPKVARGLNNLAALLSDRNQLAEAEPHMRRALEIDQVALGENHPDVGRDLNNLALLLKTTNRFVEAERLMRRAMAINEIAFGKNHPTIAKDLNNLSTLLQATNRLREAELLIRQALDIDQAFLGNEHPDIARDLNNLAAVLQATNRLAEAEPLMRRAVAIDEASLGRNHPTVAKDLGNLGGLLHATNRQGEAEELFREALQIDETSLGKDHPDVARDLSNLAHLLHAKNRLTEAEPLIRRALAIDETSFGQDHPDVAIRLNNLAKLLQDTNRLAEAEPLMWRVVAIFEKSLDENHPNVALSLNNLAQLLQASGRPTEAAPFMHRVVLILVVFTLTTGYPHPQLKNAVLNYCLLLVQLGDAPEKAIEKIDLILEPVRNQLS